MKKKPVCLQGKGRTEPQSFPNILKLAYKTTLLKNDALSEKLKIPGIIKFHGKHPIEEKH